MNVGCCFRWDVLGRKVALDIALGLNHLHRQSPPLMHRDLKSPNVLLSEEGVAKIADVGMSRSQVGELVSAQPIMTPLWAAPEVRRAWGAAQGKETPFVLYPCTT